MSQEMLEIEARGEAKGMAKQLIACIENVMKALQCTLEDACAAVGSTVEAYNEAKSVKQ